MMDIRLHLLTKVAVPSGRNALEKIWKIDNWINSLDRVINIQIILNEENRQRFKLTFDAGRSEHDQVEIERTRVDDSIRVKHIVPPPGVKSLSAVWWSECNKNSEIFARRSMLIEPCNYSAENTRLFFSILKENLAKLVAINS